MSIDLNDPEVKAAITTAVEEATSGLSTKNKELLTELKTARKGQTITPEEFTRVESERDDAQTKLKDADKARAKAEKDLKAAQDSTAAEQLANHTLLVDRGISDALIKAGVKKEYMDFVKAKYLTQAKVVEADGARKGQIGDKDIDAFFGEWAKGEEAKHFIGAPANNGGGATGGGGGATNAELMKLSPTARLDAARAQGLKT